MAVEKCDLVVIGSGPAGEKGAAQAAYFGKSIALVEKEDVLGGAAANTGTLPSETLRESPLYIFSFRRRGLFGVNFELKDKVTARDFFYRECLFVENERNRIADNIDRQDVALYRGGAAFVDTHTISVTPKDAPATPPPRRCRPDSKRIRSVSPAQLSVRRSQVLRLGYDPQHSRHP